MAEGNIIISVLCSISIIYIYNRKISDIKKNYEQKITELKYKLDGYQKLFDNNFKLIKDSLKSASKLKSELKLTDIECIICSEPIDAVYSCGHFSFCTNCIKKMNTESKCHICMQTNVLYHKLYV